MKPPSDEVKKSRPARVSILIKPSNKPPLIRMSSFRKTPKSEVISVTNPGILKYARDPDRNFLIPYVVDYPAHGLLKMNPNGSFTYYPESGFKGIDSFRWQVTDGLLDSPLGTAILNCATCNRNK